MATFSDGPHNELGGGGGDVFSDGDVLSSAGTMRQYLQDLLDSKEKQLQHAGTLGQRVLAQQMELEERVRQLQEIDAEKVEDDDVSAELRLRYRDLASTLKAWDEENILLSSAFGDGTNGQQPSPSLPLPDLPQDQPSHGPSAPSASQSRRAKNAAHRANDVEFAFEIGSSLLTEVRRLQSLLGERDKAIQDMKGEKDDLEKGVENLQTALRTQEQSADKFKEENWNLEVSLQEMRVQLSDAQAAAQRGEAETKRLTRVLAGSRESNDSYKNEVERLKSSIEETKIKHETDVAHHRKHAAALARDKSDLQQSVDTYKVELARASRRLPRFGSPFTPGSHTDAQTPRMPEDEDDPFGPGTTGMSTNRRRLDTSGLFPPDAFGPESVDNTPDPSPSRPFLAPSHPTNEIEALQQKLAHAQRHISTLKGTLNREKELRMEYRRKMLEAGVTERLDLDEDEDGEDREEEDGEVNEAAQTRPRTRAMPFRGRGYGRPGRSGSRLTLTQKLRMSANSPSSDVDDEETSTPDTTNLDESDVYPSTYIPETETSVTDSQNETFQSASPGSPAPPSNRASVVSVDGMDPEFANVLRRNSSVSLRRGANPIIRSGGRGGRGGLVGRRRGGTAYQEPRPSSLVGAPEALAAELGLRMSVGMDSVREDVPEEKEEREMKEFACQTDYKEPSAPVPAALVPIPESEVAIKPETTEISIQVDPEPPARIPEPDMVVKPETAEVSIQVDPEPEPEREPEPVVELPAVIKVDSFMQTDEASRTEILPEPEPEPEPVVKVPVAVKVNSSMQTDDTPRADISISTDPQVFPVLVDSSTLTEQSVPAQSAEMEIQTDAEPEAIPETITLPQKPQRNEADMQTQTQTPQRSEAETQTQTLSRAEYSTNAPVLPAVLPGQRIRYLSSASTATTVPRPSLFQIAQAEEDDDMNTRTELAYLTGGEPETETDADDYRDARSVAQTPSASESLDDFHSISTMTDNEFSDDDEDEDEDDTESIKVSVLDIGGQVSRGSLFQPVEEEVPSKTLVTYESQGVGTDAPVEEPERELAEISIQTDEWRPEPLAMPKPQVPPGFGLYRVGPNSQQFQFISPTPPAPPTSTSIPIAPSHSLATPPTQNLRDSTSTVIARPLRFSSPSLPVDVERRKSDESVSLNTPEAAGPRQHTQSLGMSPTIDRTRPPTMMLPPPPKMPPPPNSMPPPSFIPEKRRAPSALSSHREMPPPRPSSPPPPELIQRATTPTFGAVLTVPGRGIPPRQHGSSLPPMSVLRQPASTNSFRSAANAGTHAQVSSGSGSGLFMDSRDRRLHSATSLLSDQEDVLSRRSSVSSDFHTRGALSEPEHAGNTTLNAPTTPTRVPGNMPGSSTDPTIIHAITQTMIGEFLYKYTRRTIGKGHGERRHKRFFWVHPYTKTLYWSSGDPGSTNVTEQSAKSAYIDSVRAVLDPNPMPPGLYQYSVVISTPQREMKFTAPTKERHEIWLNALQYLLARPTPAVQSPGTSQVNGPPVTPVRNTSGYNNIHGQGGVTSPMSQRTGRSEKSGMSGESPWNVTPRGGRRSRSRISVGGSVGKRSGTPAAEYLRWTDGPGSPGAHSLHGFEQFGNGRDFDDDDLDFEIHDATLSDQEGFEGLENVRACCDGRHTVGRSGMLEHHHHDHNHTLPNHHHAHVHRPIPQFLRGNDPMPEHLQPSRPVSPAFSFRSRASSRKSGEGGGNLFSRFGTRRSKNAPTATEG
ncbi:hypothetical protein DFH11DRAFT_460464 [Phellopilus nigrolimitatus]|nr:hypothetical protein DFH11DRAFT_460464 [Phellopilus nigrolimitatus]